ncbi:unnamed protein product [Cylicocyclus nassatus]|uniref:Carbohydrate sulfotransferase n=1 Tax=Cylicocyclus nassatus TaxID=53992 RepID=A0AA36M3N5_CYLNA|nr:unnamed protein product [Cylicocyclus nassatus]
MIGHISTNEHEEEKQIQKYHNRLGKLPKRGSSDFFQMEIVEEFNSDPLPNRTDTRTADEMCSNHSDYHCIPPLRSFEAEFRVAPKHKISTCVVQKSMSTVMTAIFCFLFDENGFRRSGRKLLSEIKRTRFCEHRNEALSMRSLQWRVLVRNEDGWVHTMITRDPVDRFLSGFVDKCIRAHLPGAYCNGCKANMTCFLIREYERMVAEVRKDRFTRTFEDRHFFPQNWRCELFKHPHRVFIRYSSNATNSMLDDLFKVFRIRKVGNSTLEFLRHELNSGRTPHSTIQSYARHFLEERLRSSDFLMEYVVRMFYHDFRIFHYKLPDGFV